MTEPILDPHIPIIDPHHHLWAQMPAIAGRGGQRFLARELREALGAGHRLVGTVFVECHSGYRTDGDEELRPVGETEFVVAQAEAAGVPGACAGIVGYADLMLGERVRDVLEGHVAAAGGRFRGIRYSLSRDDDPLLRALPLDTPADVTREPQFRAGLAQLAPLNLSFDVMAFHPQLDAIVDLARDFPETTMIVNHVGGVINVGRRAGRLRETLPGVHAHLRELARLPNVVMKLGGVGMFLSGSPLLDREPMATVEEIAADWGEQILPALEIFGADRCMFESNYPVDRATCDYARLWNVFKHIARGCSDEEKQALFAGVAARVYRLEHLLAEGSRAGPADAMGENA